MNIACHLLAKQEKQYCHACCAIENDEITFKFENIENKMMTHSDVVNIARVYVDALGEFEKLAKWGLI